MRSSNQIDIVQKETLEHIIIIIIIDLSVKLHTRAISWPK